MNVWRLVKREIKYQKLNFAMGLLSVAAASGVLVAALTLLDSHDRRTSQILAEKQAGLEQEMAVMRDDYRKIMKKLGFNLLILPASQSLEEYYATGYVDEYMPEEYVKVLSGAGLMTIRHLLPTIEQRIEWPEQGGRMAILVGSRGEVPLAHLAPKEPMQLAVASEEIVVGYSLARSLGLKEGDTVSLMGEQFTVSQVRAERGTREDITLWVDLARAQSMLDRKGRINAILALKCLCAGNQLAEIRSDLARIMPATQVIEVDSRVIARAEARERASQASESSIADEIANRAIIRAELEKFAAWLSPVVILGATLWIGLLAFGNTRQRRGEIAVLRAIGLGSGKILALFLTKAILLGILGAVIGYFAGLTAGGISGELTGSLASTTGLFRPEIFVLVLAGSTLMSVLASWIPALLASNLDPADVLREE
ncbi:ABC transporter permease [Gemmatimonadota bacterium]